MGETRLSVIVPTIGRESLVATLESIHDQMREGDELIVVGDIHGYTTHPKIVSQMTLPYADWFLTVNSGDRGNTARHEGMRLAKGTHLLFMDDDDTYVPGAFDLIRAAALPDRPVFFRMQHVPWGVTIPFEHEFGVLKYGNIGTPCFIVPNLPDKLGVWHPHSDGVSGSDWTFISQTCENMEPPVWRREIIALVRPHESVLHSA